MKPSFKIGLILFVVLLLDQSLKIWVKTHMEYDEEFLLLNQEWARIHFVENNGMAFGLTLGGDYGKLALSLFRLAAVVILLLFILRTLREQGNMGVLTGFTLILAGALGNIIDSAFYGMLFSESPYYGGLATLFPKEGGYSGFLHGKVVDMLYFPMFKGIWPDWMPYTGGRPYLFFKPVFNIADLSITTGVLHILLFQRHFFKSHTAQAQPEPTETLPASEAIDGIAEQAE